MERGQTHALPLSHSVEENEHVVFIFLPRFVVVYYTECVNQGVHTLSIPHIGENCMCEVINNRVRGVFTRMRQTTLDTLQD